MIRGEHAYIRTTEPDDASAFYALYRDSGLRASLLDPRREPLRPTASECAEMIGSRQAAQGSFFTVEDLTGEILGFVNLRGLNQETPFCELGMLLLDPDSYRHPAAGEAFAFAADRVFARYRLLKMMALALDREEALKEFLAAHGFQSSGVQRDVLYAEGRYHAMETSVLFAGEYDPNAN